MIFFSLHALNNQGINDVFCSIRSVILHEDHFILEGMIFLSIAPKMVILTLTLKGHHKIDTLVQQFYGCFALQVFESVT